MNIPCRYTKLQTDGDICRKKFRKDATFGGRARFYK